MLRLKKKLFDCPSDGRPAAAFVLPGCFYKNTPGIKNLMMGLSGQRDHEGSYLRRLFIHLSLPAFTLDGTRWWHWVPAFFADDLSFYWFHRCSHHINWFRAYHVVHHSSRKYNLAFALRQTWTGNLTGTSLKNAFLHLVRPPGWSHDGSSLTAREMMAQFRREHPEEPDL